MTCPGGPGSAPPNPWRRIGEDWPQVPVVRADLGSPFLHAETRWKAGRPIVVLLNENLTQRQARCAIAHECEHLDRGRPCRGLDRQIERRVRTATARYLLPDVVPVARALASYDLGRCADELWVTVGTLRDRLATLTTDELTIVRGADLLLGA